MVHERRVRVVVEVLDAEDLLDLGHALLGDRDLVLRLLDLVVLVAHQPRRDPGERDVPLRRVAHHAADDQRGAGLVDQDRVDLVDDREVVSALHAVSVEAHRHVVAQVVEAELVVRAVGDVGRVGGPALRRRHRGLDQPHVEPEEAVDAAHPLGVALGEVVVDGDDVHALARQRVQVPGKRGDERLALAGLHLGDVALVQRGPAHQLHVEVPLADRAARGLAHGREGLGQQVVERLPVGGPLPQLAGLRPELVVGEVLDLGLERVHELRDRLEVLELAAFADVGELVEYRHEVPFGAEEVERCRLRFYRSPAVQPR